MAKRFHAGAAARNGVVGALLVRSLAFLQPLEDQIRNVLAIADEGSLPILVVITALNGVAEELFFRGAAYAAIPRHPVVWTTVAYTVATLATGKRVLFLEEVQSDWHQQGRERGYKGAESLQDIEAQAKNDFNKFYGGKGSMSDEEWKELSNRVEDWHNKIQPLIAQLKK